MLNRKTRVEQLAQEAGDIVRLGYTRRGGETREQFAARTGLCPNAVHDIVSGKVSRHDYYGHVSTQSREVFTKMVASLGDLLKAEEKKRLQTLVGKITPQGFCRQDRLQG